LNSQHNQDNCATNSCAPLVDGVATDGGKG
jgi:hypothetical protein